MAGKSSNKNKSPSRKDFKHERKLLDISSRGIKNMLIAVAPHGKSDVKRNKKDMNKKNARRYLNIVTRMTEKSKAEFARIAYSVVKFHTGRVADNAIGNKRALLRKEDISASFGNDRLSVNLVNEIRDVADDALELQREAKEAYQNSKIN